ncbi:MAG: hypothetical protein EOP35_21180 [Rubrivivax sp.]|nr:MAG: hypothetical protein EOP35_21180 [Rubrivivax sp.]
MPERLAGLRAAAASGAAPRLAGELRALFERIAERPDKVQWVQRALAADLPGEPDAALARACAAVAAAIDAEPATFDRLGYHNRQHFCEVALTAHGLCLLNRLGTVATQLVHLAALVHDVVHEGIPQPAFAQERASVEHVRPLLRAAGVSNAQVERLMALVLATAPGPGTAFMAAACDAHVGPVKGLPAGTSAGGP